jgi:uncharacterized protein YndB with AHSA1/START domain
MNPLIELSVSQVISAPAEQAFDVWMDPKSPGSPWFGAHQLLIAPVVDGLFYVAVRHEGRTWPHYGRFLRIERPRLAEYTWISEATLGYESTVQVTFESQGAATLVTLRHSGVPDDAMGRRHQDGWTWVLSMFAERFKTHEQGSTA